MKKNILPILLIACMALPSAVCAASVSADELTVSILKDWASEKYGCKISEGLLVLEANGGKLIIEVLPKAKLVKVCSIFTPYEKRSKREMIELANKFNNDKRFLRIAIDSKGKQWLDYYIVYNGGLNSTNFMEVLDWFVGLKESWDNFVVNGGDKAKN